MFLRPASQASGIQAAGGRDTLRSRRKNTLLHSLSGEHRRASPARAESSFVLVARSVSFTVRDCVQIRIILRRPPEANRPHAPEVHDWNGGDDAVSAIRGVWNITLVHSTISLPGFARGTTDPNRAPGSARTPWRPFRGAKPGRARDHGDEPHRIHPCGRETPHERSRRFFRHPRQHGRPPEAVATNLDGRLRRGLAPKGAAVWPAGCSGS